MQYDCDVAVLLGETLFIFECKNYNVPLGRISELSHLIDSISSFRKQVARIADQFDQHPEIVREHFGADIKWKRIVPCVLQALPWSMGRWGDVYSYDQSALIRFIKEGAIGVHNTTSERAKQITSRHSIKLRAKQIPTDEELLKELENPVQLRLHSKGWDLSKIALPIGKDFFLALPEWRQRALSLEEQFEALGFDAAQTCEILQELSAEPPSMMETALARTTQSLSTAKKGRNEKCQCGSGIKYKKCCGKP